MIITVGRSFLLGGYMNNFIECITGNKILDIWQKNATDHDACCFDNTSYTIEQSEAQARLAYELGRFSGCFMYRDIRAVAQEHTFYKSTDHYYDIDGDTGDSLVAKYHLVVEREGYYYLIISLLDDENDCIADITITMDDTDEVINKAMQELEDNATVYIKSRKDLMEEALLAS